MAEKRVIELEIQDNVKSLKTQYKEAVQEVQKMSSAYGETSAQAIKAAKAAAELKDRIEESKSLTDAFNPDAKFNALSSSIGGVLNGFQAYEGALGLIGSESEALQETLLKVQSAMALSQGIQGALEAKDSFKKLGAVVNDTFGSMTKASKLFAVTGIGALVTGVAYLMGAFDDTTQSISKYASAQKTSNDIQQKAIEDSAEELSALNKLQTQINDETLTRKEKNLAVKKLQDAYPDLLKNVNAEKLSIGELNKAVALNIKLAEARARVNAAESIRAEKYQQILQEEILLNNYKAKLQKALVAEDQDQIDKWNGWIAKSTQVVNGYKEQIKQIDGITKADEALIAKVEQQTKVYETEKPKVIKQVKEVANYTRQLEKERIDAMEDGMEKRIKLLQFELAGELSKIDKNGKKAGELRKAITGRYEKEIENVREEYKKRELSPERQKTEDDFLIDASNRRKNFRINIQVATNNELIKLQKDLIKKQKELDKASARETLKERTDLALKYAKTFTDAYSSLNSLLNASDNERLKKVKSGSKEEENIKRRMFKRDKALRISQTVVDTASNIVTSVRNGGGVPTGIPFGIAAGAMGALQIAAIAKAKFDGGDNGTQNAPDATAGTNVSAPQFNTIGSSGINQLAQLQMQPVQAYVVSGQVTSAQALDRNRIQNSSL